MCIIRLGVTDERAYTLIPRDGSALGSDGAFPCGREAGYEGKELLFPNITCDECTLQFEF
jgi:hypothetical protein